MIGLVVSFVFGVVAIIVTEALVLYFLLNRLLKKKPKKNKDGSSSNSQDLDPQQSLSFTNEKQGVVWVLEPEKVPKRWSEDKVQKEQKSKKEISEVFPVKKRAKIKDHSLILNDPDGSQTTIHLVGCMVSSVSASNLSSRKWAKRYPIKIESRNSVIYNGARTCYVYLETSWEKESWCKALRLASHADKERENWYAKLSKEFHEYLTSLNAGYPSFMKPSTGFTGEPMDRSARLDGSSSKVRLFLKKLAKKTAKSGVENKSGGNSLSLREERKLGEKSRSAHDLLAATGSVKTSSTEKTTNGHLDDDTHSESQSQMSVNSDADFDDRFAIDDGTLCWNLLISRLFFDARGNTDVKSSIQERIQRTLANMRTPSYIGGVTCTGLDVGTLPPYIHSMRVLPMDMNEVWAMEMDIEYSGGAVLDIETRLEVRESEFERGIVDKSLESASAEEVTSDLLEGFESFENQLKLSGERVDEIEKYDEGDSKPDGMKKCTSWKSPYVSRWKSILNSIANQVSQVPISLAIRVASVRGTLRLHIKPPPSDQLWFSFTSMPEIDFNLDSSVGEHRISNGHIALLLENRFKEAVRDTLVLPNCEYVCIPWMLAEKDDWAPRKVAPFIWINHESSSDPVVGEETNCQPGEAKTKSEVPKVSKQASSNHLDKREKTASVVSPRQLTCEPEESASSSKLELDSPSSTSDLRTPLLTSEPHGSPEHQPVGAASVRERPIPIGEDANPKKTGRKARMMDLGKKMGEKLEEKRRHLEEKSRNIVEKMRGP